MGAELERLEATIRIYCDIRPVGPADIAYLYAQTTDNEESVFHAARKIIDGALSSKILLMDSTPNKGYAGYTFWKERLIELGIREKCILDVRLNVLNHNTLTEAEAVIRFAKQSNLKSMIVSAAPFHQIRAFMTTVRVALAEYPELKIYSIPGAALSWNECVSHSQGLLSAKRSDLIAGEFARIEKYYQKGDLISFNQVLDYLDARDRSNDS